VQALLSLQVIAVCWQAPVDGLHVSAVQASLSLQFLGANTQPVAGLHESVVQILLSLQVIGVPPIQTPPEQTSPVVQALLSEHGAVLLVKTQAPVAGLHESSVQTLLSLHTVGAPDTQTPPEQVSPVVQALLSEHGAVLSVKTQPVAGLHESVVQTLLSLQTIGVLTQAPVEGLHESAVQALLSLQFLGAPVQIPPEHTSPEVQALPSLQGAVLLVCTQPLAGSHESFVQALLSSQLIGM
jgi:hypothetical protein